MLDSSVDIVLPTTLEMIRKPERYTLAVEYVPQEVPPELTLATNLQQSGRRFILTPMQRFCSDLLDKALATIASWCRWSQACD